MTIESQQHSESDDLQRKLEWMKGRLAVETDEELISKALSLLHQCIEWEDKGYTVGAFTKTGPFADREFVEYRILPVKQS